MKKSVRIVALVLLIVLVAATLSSCGLLNRERLIQHPRIWFYSIRLQLKGYYVQHDKGYVNAFNPETGDYIDAWVCGSFIHAIRTKHDIANGGFQDADNQYVGRSGKIVYCGTDRGVMAGVGFPESAWVFVVSKLDFLGPKILAHLS